MGLPESFVIPENETPDRADRLISHCLAGRLSRSSAAKLIRVGRILVDGRPIRASTVLNPGDRVRIVRPVTDEASRRSHEIPPFEIVFEDSQVVVVDKPVGLVVHPGAGRPSGTLMDALVATRPEMIGVGETGRWGVVHRLDRDTSGVMVLAKTIQAHVDLSEQFRRHTVHRVYLALVRGSPGQEEGLVDAALGRHAKDRKRMSTVAAKSRQAVTRWAVLERLGPITLLEVRPQTGRAHQIRVHLASVGLPVLGDPVYGRSRRISRSRDPLLRRASSIMRRQALHAAILGFRHPSHQGYVEFSSPLPGDMQSVLSVCQSMLEAD